MSARQRIDQQPGFVLHSYPYRETSLIVEVFSRDHGRIGLVAKGARRPMSQLRGVLMAFQPLLIDWSGGGEMKTLVRAEWQGGQPLLGGQALLCAYYLNELLMRLLPREDPHPTLYRAYGDALRALAAGEGQEVILRRFELALLQELGYGLLLETDAPYLLPRDMKPKPASRRNEPAYLGHIVESVAKWRGEDPHWLSAQTDDNVRNLFGINV